MIEVSIKTLWYFAAGGSAILIWFIRLEASVRANKISSCVKLKAVELKIDNHITLSKEKHDRIFNKLEMVEKSITKIELSVALIAEHLKEK